MKSTATVLISLAVLITPTTVAGQMPTTQPQPELRNGCAKLFTQKQFHHYAGRVFKRPELSRKAKLEVIKMMRCQHSPKAERKMRIVRRHLIAERKERAELAALTPYGPCYGGMWAVPCEIIDGESDGSWSVVNSQGCLGPYQFCKKRVPWPVRTLADKIAHHAEASSLWQGGAGCSHWEQTSSAC